MTVAVVTDSAAALPPAVASAFDVTVVPLWIEVDGHPVRDGTIDPDAVLTAARVTTSGPTPGEFAAAIRGALDRADAAVVLTVTAAVSGTHDAARLGATGFGPSVQVLDTRSAAGGEALVVLAAAAAAGHGASLDAVMGRAEAVAARVRVVGALASFERLARSGRVPGVAARAADRFGVRPMFELRNGKVRPLRPSGRDGDLDRMTRQCLADRPTRASTLHAVVMHAGARVAPPVSKPGSGSSTAATSWSDRSARPW
jgi:DegV family protein with EDD domain